MDEGSPEGGVGDHGVPIIRRRPEHPTDPSRRWAPLSEADTDVIEHALRLQRNHVDRHSMNGPNRLR